MLRGAEQPRWRAYDVEVIPSPRPASPPPAPVAPLAAPQPSLATQAVRTGKAARAAAAADDDGVLIDVLPRAEYEREITEALLDTIASGTAAEIMEVRRCLVKTASDRGWLE